MSKCTIFIVAVQFTEGTWVTISEHFDTKPILEAMMELLIMKVEQKTREGITLSQSSAMGMAEDRARAFRREEGALERRESKVEWSMALERLRCWTGKSIASGEDQSKCLDERENSWKALESWVEWLGWYPRISDTKSWVEKTDTIYAAGECSEALRMLRPPKKDRKEGLVQDQSGRGHPPDQRGIRTWECQRSQSCLWCRKKGKFWGRGIFYLSPVRQNLHCW